MNTVTDFCKNFEGLVQRQGGERCVLTDKVGHEDDTDIG